jgi:transcriptional regulator with XRE-family HTH domain
MDDDVPAFSPEELKAIREARGLSQRGLEDAIGISRGYLSKVEKGREKLTERMARLYRGLRDGVELDVLHQEYSLSKALGPQGYQKWTTITSEEVMIHINDDCSVRAVYRRILLRAHREVFGQPLFQVTSEQESDLVSVLYGGELSAIDLGGGEHSVGIDFPKPVRPGEDHFIELISVPRGIPVRADGRTGYLTTSLEWYNLQRLTVMLWMPIDLAEQSCVLRVDGLRPHDDVNTSVATPVSVTTNGLVCAKFKDLTQGLRYGLVWQHGS